ncbi:MULTISPECIES: universal stress protein [unclassified Streptomyces]|uniref:universal stress protein n=1 Tax=unclassified Streptomyces TaxID=2593676 RepID=UPI003D74AB4B
MVRTVVVGLDGSPESKAAAAWAAREAAERRLPVTVLHVWQPVPEAMTQTPPLGAETQQHWTERIPRETATVLKARHPGLQVTAEQRHGSPFDVLVDAAKNAELLVLGSRGLSGLGGFVVGSVGMYVVAHAQCPVILVRAGEQAADEHRPDPSGAPTTATPYRPVVLGLNPAGAADAVVEFAFEAAARRDTTLHVVHGWTLPPYYTYGLGTDASLHEELTRQQTAALNEVLAPWREKYPTVEVVADARSGSAASHLIDASRDASLVVVGRRVRRTPIGARTGPVAHAVLHHATAPVAVVSHS